MPGRFSEQYKGELTVLKILNQSGITGLPTRDWCQCLPAEDLQEHICSWVDYSLPWGRMHTIGNHGASQ